MPDLPESVYVPDLPRLTLPRHYGTIREGGGCSFWQGVEGRRGLLINPRGSWRAANGRSFSFRCWPELQDLHDGEMAEDWYLVDSTNVAHIDVDDSFVNIPALSFYSAVHFQMWRSHDPEAVVTDVNCEAFLVATNGEKWSHHLDEDALNPLHRWRFCLTDTILSTLTKGSWTEIAPGDVQENTWHFEDLGEGDVFSLLHGTELVAVSAVGTPLETSTLSSGVLTAPRTIRQIKFFCSTKARSDAPRRPS